MTTSRFLNRRAARATPPSGLFLHFLANEVRPGGGRAPPHQCTTLVVLSPLLAWGALLGAIPIIIHLLNRRKFRRVEWAPMQHLEAHRPAGLGGGLQVEQLLLMLLRVAAASPCCSFSWPARGQPDGPGRLAQAGGRSSQIVLIDDSLSMGYPDRARHQPSPSRQAQGRTAGSLVASARAEGPIHDPGGLEPEGPGRPRGRRVAPGGSGRRRLVDPSDGRPCLVALGPGRGRGGPPVVYLPDPPAHHPDRSPQVRLGRRRLADRPEVGRGRRPRPDLRRRGRRLGERRAPGDRPPRPDDPGRGREQVGGGDPQRLAPGPRGTQGDPPGRRSADRGEAPRDRPPGDRPRPLDRPVPRPRPARPFAPASRRRPVGRQPSMGGRPRQGLAPGPPGRRRPVVGAVRLGGRVPGAALSIGIGAAEAWRVEVLPRQRLPLASARLARRPRPGQHRRPPEQANRLLKLVREDGVDDLHRVESRRGRLQRPCSSRGNDKILPTPG